jgi:hypothetical protein
LNDGLKISGKLWVEANPDSRRNRPQRTYYQREEHTQKCRRGAQENVKPFLQIDIRQQKDKAI